MFDNYFKSLEGSWTLERKISTGENLNGKAVFEPISSTAFLLLEEGEMTLTSGNTMSATRSWYWHISGQGSLEITYDPDRLQDYHFIDLSEGEAGLGGSANHLCGDDTYLGQYQFLEERFSILQVIKGPNKNYSVASVYLRD